MELLYGQYDTCTVGKIIKHERANVMGVTMNEFAEVLSKHDLNVSVSTLKKWESGSIEIPLNKLLILCNIFGCEIDYLLGRQKCKTKKAVDICEATGLSGRSASLLADSPRDSFYNLVDRFICSTLGHDTELSSALFWYQTALDAKSELSSSYPDLYNLVIDSANAAKEEPEYIREEFESQIYTRIEKMRENAFQRIVEDDFTFSYSVDTLLDFEKRQEYVEHIVERTYYSAFWASRLNEYEYALTKNFIKVVEDRPLEQTKNKVSLPSFLMNERKE